VVLAGVDGRIRRALLAIGLFSICINLLMLTIPVYMLQVFDRVLTSHSVETLGLLTVGALGAIVLMVALDGVRAHLLLQAGLKLDRDLSGRLLAASVRGSLAGRPADAQGLRDLAQLRGFVTSPVVASLFDAPLVPLYLLVMALIHPSLGFMGLVGALLLLVLAYANQRTTEAGIKRASAETAFILNDAQGQMRNAEAIEAMGLMPALEARWHRLQDSALRKHMASGAIGGWFHAGTRFIRFALQILSLGLGAWLVLQDQITAGMMFAASIILGRGLAPIDVAVGAWPKLLDAAAAYGRIRELIGASPHQDKLSLPAPLGHLAVENALFAVPGQDKAILRGIAFALEPGEMLGVIGPVAAGKTTLARLILGVLKPTSGKVRLDGADLSQWPREQLGRHIGYLPQGVELFAGTVAENIARMASPDADRVVDAARSAGVHEMILRLPNGYDTVIGNGPVLSPGQAQLIALARAVYGDPCLLVLDEPNANLDGEGEAALAQALGRAKARGATIVVIAHNAGLLLQADKILMLRDGAMQAFGPRDEILARSRAGAPPAGAWLAPVRAVSVNPAG
jgi:PrtD family type I secretion system ABC transporter